MALASAPNSDLAHLARRDAVGLFAPTAPRKPHKHVSVDDLFPPTPLDIENERQSRAFRQAAAIDRAQCKALAETDADYREWLAAEAQADELR